MAWVKPLINVVARKEIPLPHWMKAKPDRKDWILTLECGHEVKRASYDGKPLPERCQCSKCGYSQ